MIALLLAAAVAADSGCMRAWRAPADTVAAPVAAARLARAGATPEASCPAAPAIAAPHRFSFRQPDSVLVLGGTPARTSIRVTVDTAGVVVSDSAGLQLPEPHVSATWDARTRRWRLTAVSVGVAPLIWSYGDDTAQTTITVQAKTAPPPEESAPSPAASLSRSSAPATGATGAPGVPEPPRAVPTWPETLATAPCSDTIAAARLQTAVGRARPGTVLCLAPGETFRGTLTLPARGDSGWVVVRTAPAEGQPAPGTRVRPSHRATLATIEAEGTTPAIVAAPGARGWYLAMLEVRTDSTLGTLTYALVDLAVPPSATQFARDLVLDRLWIHGWPHRPLRRCVSLQSAATAIVHSWIDECHEKGTDSQAIWGASGPGPYLIHDNYLAGAGENVMFGGADPRFPGVHPSDITFTRNHVHTPISWKGTWTKKNLFELKNAQRVRVDSNVFDGSWADGQTGYALVLKSTNQGCRCTDCGSRDVSVRHNLVVRSGAALTINGRDTNNCPNGGSSRLDSLTRRIHVIENYSDQLGEPTLDTRGVSLYTNPADVLLRRNSWLAPPGRVNAYTGASPVTATRLRVDGDVLTQGRYVMAGCWTGPCAPGLVMRAALIGNAPLPAQARTFRQFPSLGAAVAAGYGVSRATIDGATRGVVQRP